MSFSIERHKGENKLDLLLIENIIVCLGAFFGFIYGGILFFRPKKALYAQMITLALGVIGFGRLFLVCRILTGGEITETFQLGFVGMFASFLFFFSANFGAVDSLIDDSVKRSPWSKLINFLAPLTVLVLYLIFFVFSNVSLMWRIFVGILSFNIALSSYFNLKHLLSPDIDKGVITCLRPYNLLALIYAASVLMECIGLSSGNTVLAFVAGLISTISIILIIPLIARGVKKWLI